MRRFARVPPALSILSGVLVAVLIAAGCGNDAPAAADTYRVVEPPSLRPGDPVPTASKPVLQVSGKVGTPLSVDMATLERFGRISYDVPDPFTKKVESYSGVLASSVLAMADPDAEATLARAHALDDFSIDVKISDLDRYPAMIVTRLSGKRVSVADGGPLKLIWPYHAYDLDHNVYDHQWVWSLDKLTLR